MLKIGFAQADITPAMGADLDGGFAARGRWPVHDRLLAVACVIDNGESSVALVGIDTVIVPCHLADEAKRMIAAATNIPAGNILIAASHTHQGGPLLTGLISESDPRYEKQVIEAIASATIDAWKSRQPAQLANATGQVSGIHFNRRFLMRDGREITHPGKLHPDIVRPAGPVDPDVNVLAMRNLEGRVVGAVVQFGCHATVVGGEEYSADFIYYSRKHLAEQFKADMPIVFLPGASGDVTQVNNLAEGHDFGHEVGDRMGRAIAVAATDALTIAIWRSGAEIRVESEVVQIPVKPERPMDDERPALGLGSGDFWEKIFIRERAELAKLRAATPLIPCTIQGICIGDLALVANGSELFAQSGLDIKSAAPFRSTWVVTLANEYLGYVPTATAFFAGGYEPRPARTSFLAPEAAQRIVEGSVRVLGRLAVSGNSQSLR